MSPALHSPARAPALLRVFPKTVYGEVAEAEAWQRALVAMRDSAHGQILPIWFLRKRLGWAVNDRRRCCVYWRCAAIGIADIEAARGLGQSWRTTFYKNNSAGAGALSTLWYDMWSCQGQPSAGASPYSGTALTGRAFTNNSPAGGIQMGPPVGSMIKQFGKLWPSVTVTAPTLFKFYDRTYAYDNCTYSSSLQNLVTTVTVPRYASNGAGGLQVCLTGISGSPSVAMTLAAMAYVNDQGSSASAPIQTNFVTVCSGRTAWATTYGSEVLFPCSGQDSAGNFFELAPQDLGVQKLSSITWSATDAATYCLFLARDLAVVTVPVAGVHCDHDQVTEFMNYERIHDGAHVSFFMAPTIASAGFHGSIETLWT